MIFGHLSMIFFYYSSGERSTVTRDLKNFFAVVRNMPDTLAKFGGDPLSSFQVIVFHKSIFWGQNRSRKSSKNH